jgi:hypothetical protein
VIPLTHGEWSRAYAFSHDAREYIVRLWRLLK